MTKAEKFAEDLKGRIKDTSLVRVDGDLVIVTHTLEFSTEIKENASEVLTCALLDHVTNALRLRGVTK